jgi:hypothetical protein
VTLSSIDFLHDADDLPLSPISLRQYTISQSINMRKISMENQTEQEATHSITEILSPNFTFTKRQLGIILLAIGGLSFLGILGLDFVGGGREGGIGPAQQTALILMGVVTLVGLSLIPLGDNPA